MMEFITIGGKHQFVARMRAPIQGDQAHVRSLGSARDAVNHL